MNMTDLKMNQTETTIMNQANETSNTDFSGYLNNIMVIDNTIHGVLLCISTLLTLLLGSWFYPRRNRGTDKKFKRLVILCIVVNIVNALRCFGRLIIHRFEYSSTVVCKLIHSLNVGLSRPCYAIVYLILFLRFRAVYSSSVMVKSTKFRIVSWITTAIFLLYQGTNASYLIVHVIRSQYILTKEHSCVMIRFGLNVTETNALHLIPSIITQVVLLLAFIVPLITHITKKSLAQQNNSKMVEMIKRSILGMVFVIVGDTLVYLLLPYFPYHAAMASVGITLNTVACHLIFGKWRQIFLPCLNFMDKKKESTNSAQKNNVKARG